MSKNKANYKLKVFQVKSEYTSFADEELVKKTSKSDKYAKYKSKEILDNITLYYKKTFDVIPRWYSGFLEQDGKDVYSTNASGYFFKTIVNDDKTETKFAITFGNGDTALDLEKFNNRFGLIIALNLAESFYSLKKNTLAGTMSNIKEQASKKMDISSFQVDFEKDLVESLTVKIGDNEYFIGNITGSSGLSFTTSKSIHEIDFLLKELKRIYSLDKYKTDYPFIDNISEIKNDPKLKKLIEDNIIKVFKENEDNKVWFGLPEIIEWEKTIDFTFSTAGKKQKNYNEICFDTVRNFIDFARAQINTIDDFKKIKIHINTSDDITYDYKWTLLDALYASVEIGENIYVYSGKRIFLVNRDYQTDINKRFESIDIDTDKLPDNTMTKSEGDYLKEITKENDDFVLVDAKCIVLQTSIEPCDIFRKSNKSFIHVKKYGSSSVLSHLFNQAYVAAAIFSNSANGRKLIIDKIYEYDRVKNYDKDADKNNHSVVLAIMTVKQLKPGEHANLPFFSKINLVKTVEQIKGMGYKDVKLMYIYSSAPLYNEEV